jgi:excisionase family DNA binding protein
MPCLVDIKTVARTLGVTERLVRRLVTERRIPFVKVGYFIRFDPEEVARWVDCHRVSTRTGHMLHSRPMNERGRSRPAVGRPEGKP